MTRKRLAILILGIILFACLLACGYYGAKTLRRTYQRRAAMAAYEKKDYEKAERLLLAYVAKDPNAEAEFVALANIYEEFGNTGMAAQMWQMASSLNPLNAEYRDNMLKNAIRSAGYQLIYTDLGRKVKADEKLDDRELALYVLSACRTGRLKDAEAVYKKYSEADRNALQKDELGKFADFLMNYSNLSGSERDAFLDRMVKSDDPVIRFEALYAAMRILMTRLAQAASDEGTEEIEAFLKKLVETNYYSGTPLLTDYYFSLHRYADVIATAGPYLKHIDNISMYLMYMESCAFEEKTDLLREMEQKLLEKGPRFGSLADYCGVLIPYLEKDRKTLEERVRKYDKAITSPLMHYILLQVALESGSYSEIRTVATAFFAAPPIENLRAQALQSCMEYIVEEMRKPENQNDPSQMAELAQILIKQVKESRILTTIILADQQKKGLAKEEDILAAVEQYPDTPMLLLIAAEYMVMHGNGEQALSLLEQLENAGENGELNSGALFLKMLAMAELERIDEAAEIFRKLLEDSQFNLSILKDYFSFCTSAKREKDLAAMADMLENSQDAKLKQYAVFFRAASLIVTGDEAKRDEALKMLVATPNDDPEMAFYAAVRLSEFDWLDDSEAKFNAILKTYSNPVLIYANLSEVYKAKGDEAKALQAAKEGYEHSKSQLAAYVYAQRLSDAGRYEEAVSVLNLPRRAGDYRANVVELWTTCMKKAIEKSIAEQRYLPAEELCKHLLVIVPDDAFAKERLEFVHEKLFPKKDRAKEQ